MSEIAGGILVQLGLLFFGYNLTRVLPSIEIGMGERLFLGLAISLGLVPLFLFYGLLVGANLEFFSSWVLMAGAAFGLAFCMLDLRRLNKQGNRTRLLRGPSLESPYQAVLVGMIALLLVEKLVFVCVQGFTFPAYFWDAVETWNYRAKVLHSTGQLDFNPQSEFFLGGGAPDYPLGPSLFRAWIATLLGGWSEKAVVLHSLVAYILLFVLVYAGLSKRMGWQYSLMFAYLGVSLPLMVHHAYAGYADLLLSLFFTGCLVYGYNYLITHDRLSGAVSALFLMSSLFTKNEGMMLILPVILITLLFATWQKRLSLGSASVYLAIVALFILPWVILKTYFGLSYSPRGMHTVLELHFQGLVEIFNIVFRQGSFNLFGLFFILSTLFYFRIWLKTELKFLAFPIFLLLGAILGVFLFTSNYKFLESQTAFNRALMVFMPSYIYLVGLTTNQRLGDRPQNE